MIQILPAIDIINGRCVRLTKGDYSSEKVYHEDPLTIAKNFEAVGSEWIHIVDLDAAKSSEKSNLDTIVKIANETSLKIQMGGGIRNEEMLNKVFDHGVARAIIGSTAAKHPDKVYKWIEKHGGEKIVIGTDVNNEFIATEGWQEDSGIHIDTYIEQYKAHGGQLFLCTDIAKDGMLQGISMNLYKRLMEKYPDIKLIASGGVASMEDIDQASEAKMYGVVVGKAIYEGRITLEQLFKSSLC
jgi:phosphoribosylformimino-5-aminoimidazole carboxamide ribotide isomerase